MLRSLRSVDLDCSVRFLMKVSQVMLHEWTDTSDLFGGLSSLCIPKANVRIEIGQRD